MYCAVPQQTAMYKIPRRETAVLDAQNTPQDLSARLYIVLIFKVDTPAAQIMDMESVICPKLTPYFIFVFTLTSNAHTDFFSV